MSHGICICTTNNDIEHAEVAIYSFLKNNEWFRGDIIIAHDDIDGAMPEDARERLNALYFSITFKEMCAPMPEYDTTVFISPNTIITENIEKDFESDTIADTLQRFYCPEGNDQILQEYNLWQKSYFFNDGIFYPKQLEDKDKYVVCACAKGENEYIVEWIEHYLNLGFDKIFICDNNDDNSLIGVISDYVYRDVVEILDCQKYTCFQEQIYHMFCVEGNYKWCAYFDCDEFLELGVYSNIKDYLSAKSEDCVAFNWVIFGSNGELNKKEGRVQDRFKVPYLPLMSMYNGFLKGIIRGGRRRFTQFKFNGGHLPWPVFDEKQFPNTYNVGGYFKCNTVPFQTSYPLRYKEGYIKHYYTKSFEEWISKAKRGWPVTRDALPACRYFMTDSRITPDKERYNHNLFLRDEWMEGAMKDPIEFLKETNIIEIAHDKFSNYGVVSYVLYLMGHVTGKVILFKGLDTDDFLFTTLLEHAFVTGNRIIYCKNDDEVIMAFDKYSKETGDTYYYYKVF